MIPLLCILFALSLPLCGCERETPQPERDDDNGGAAVPGEYRALYDELDRELADMEDRLSAVGERPAGDTIYSAELIVANGNRGESLLRPSASLAVEKTLDSMESLGISGVTVSIGYPLLCPGYPRHEEYLDFYMETAAEIRERGLALIVDSTTLFPNMLAVDYEGLTMERYKSEKRLMVETVIRELRPDYYTIENEPLTQRANTGLDFSIREQADIVNYLLADLDTSYTRMGAGAGTWEDIAYFESLASGTDIDYIDMHIYPIQGDLADEKTVRIGEIASAYRKGLAVGEAWLYKAALSELGPDHTPAAAEEIFARDAYSFWIPLDQRFLEAMLELSRLLEMEYLSPFWTQYFYAYLDYDPDIKAQGYSWVMELASSQAWIKIQVDSLSPTGEAYRDLVRGR